MELIKKHLFHGKILDRAKIIKELGDVYYYLAMLCYECDTSLSEVAEENDKKLQERHPNGFQTNYESDSTRAYGNKTPDGIV